jgi:predicted  nucleic acid-binding Zn-ribbon protein
MRKRSEIQTLKDRLDNGLEKMKSASDQVAELQQNLQKEMVVVEEKRVATEQLLVQVRSLLLKAKSR